MNNVKIEEFLTKYLIYSDNYMFKITDIINEFDIKCICYPKSNIIGVNMENSSPTIITVILSDIIEHIKIHKVKNNQLYNDLLKLYPEYII